MMYDITTTFVDANGAVSVGEYDRLFDLEEDAVNYALSRLSRSPWAIFCHVRLVFESGSTIKIRTVWPVEVNA